MDHWSFGFADSARREYEDRRKQEELQLHRKRIIDEKGDDYWLRLSETMRQDVNAYNSRVIDCPALAIEFKFEKGQPYSWTIRNSPSSASLHCFRQKGEQCVRFTYKFNSPQDHKGCLEMKVNTDDEIEFAIAGESKDRLRSIAEASRWLLTPVFTGKIMAL